MGGEGGGKVELGLGELKATVGHQPSLKMWRILSGSTGDGMWFTRPHTHGQAIKCHQYCVSDLPTRPAPTVMPLVMFASAMIKKMIIQGACPLGTHFDV